MPAEAVLVGSLALMCNLRAKYTPTREAAKPSPFVRTLRTALKGRSHYMPAEAVLVGSLALMCNLRAKYTPTREAAKPSPFVRKL